MVVLAFGSTVWHSAAVVAHSTYGHTGKSPFPSFRDGLLRMGPALFVREVARGFVHCPCTVRTTMLISEARLRLLAKRNSSCLPRKCLAKLPNNDFDDEDLSKLSSSSANNSKAAPSVHDVDEHEISSSKALGRMPYRVITGLAALGFLEATYLTWTKLSGGSVVCSTGGNCSDVLNSSYASVFGVPLSLVGMVAYGVVAFLGIRTVTNTSDWAVEEKWGRWVLLGIVSTMAAASAYFMFILIVRLDGASCTYCVTSAILSLSLLLSTLRGFDVKDLQGVASLQLGTGASVLLGLSVAFADSNSALGRSGEVDLPPVEPEVSTVSSSEEITLAKHLQSVGARMYGAFWCSHCFEQKQMFGREAMKYVHYVECYPEGYRKGVPIAKECEDANIQGFPTWVINGKTLSGEQELADLAEASEFKAMNLK